MLKNVPLSATFALVLNFTAKTSRGIVDGAARLKTTGDVLALRVVGTSGDVEVGFIPEIDARTIFPTDNRPLGPDEMRNVVNRLFARATDRTTIPKAVGFVAGIVGDLAVEMMLGVGLGGPL